MESPKHPELKYTMDYPKHPFNIKNVEWVKTLPEQDSQLRTVKQDDTDRIFTKWNIKDAKEHDDRDPKKTFRENYDKWVKTLNEQDIQFLNAIPKVAVRIDQDWTPEGVNEQTMSELAVLCRIYNSLITKFNSNGYVGSPLPLINMNIFDYPFNVIDGIGSDIIVALHNLLDRSEDNDIDQFFDIHELNEKFKKTVQSGTARLSEARSRRYAHRNRSQQSFPVIAIPDDDIEDLPTADIVDIDVPVARRHMGGMKSRKRKSRRRKRNTKKYK